VPLLQAGYAITGLTYQVKPFKDGDK